MAVQAIMDEQDMGTQFPEVITRDEAEKLWFQDSTVQQQRKIYTLEQIWRFLSVQIKHSGIIEDKLKAIDAEENDCGDEGESEMSEATMAEYKLRQVGKVKLRKVDESSSEDSSSSSKTTNKGITEVGDSAEESSLDSIQVSPLNTDSRVQSRV